MIAINAFSQIAALGISLGVQTIYILLVARGLTLEQFGQFNLVFAISQILFLGGDLGVHNTALRRMAGDRSKAREIFGLFLYLKLLLASAVFLVAVLIAAGLAWERGSALGGCMFLFGTGVLFQSANMAFNIGHQAHGKLYLASFNVLFSVALHALLGSTALWFGGKLVWLGAANALAQGTALLLNILLFSRIVHTIPRPRRSGGREFLVQSIPVGLGTLLETTTSRIGIILITYLAGETATGLYSAASRITGALRNVPMGIFSAVLPALAAQTANPAAVRRIFSRYLKIALLLVTLITPLLWLLSNWLIGIIYPPEYAEAASILRILSLSLPCVFLSGGLLHLLLSQEELVARYPWAAGVGTLGTIVLYSLLVPSWGARGAALAQFLAEGIVLLAYFTGTFGYFKRNLGTEPRA